LRSVRPRGKQGAKCVGVACRLQNAAWQKKMHAKVPARPRKSRTARFAGNGSEGSGARCAVAAGAGSGKWACRAK